MVRHIPNSLTLLNLFSGCCGIIACLQHQYQLVPLFIGISMVADFLDGFVARALKVKSELGAQLDSLADMVTFGVLPGMMLFSIIGSGERLPMPDTFSSPSNPFTENQLPLLGFVYTIFACLRLAKFNLDTRQTVDFIGLNTPAGCFFILGFYMYFFTTLNQPDHWNYVQLARLFAMIIPFVLAYLMVAEIEIFSMKGNPFDWKRNKMRVLFLISAIPQLLFLRWIGFSTIILSYLLFAVLHNATKKKQSV